jgi:hypothetical protein
VVYLILIAVGAALGLVIGRWWTIAAAVVPGVWVATVTDVDEVPPWFLGVGYAGLFAIGAAVGVALRKAPRTR